MAHGAIRRSRATESLHSLLSDFEPKGAVARSYGVYRDQDGIAERALFVIDENGMIAWSYCSPLAVNPGAAGILDALDSLPPVEKTSVEKKMALLRVPVTPLDHVLGDDDAPVTVVQYGDYECPFCAAAQPIVKQLLERHGRNIRFVFRHFPLVEMHPHAEPAAETAEFAGSHGLFWPMHEAIFANQHRLNIPLLIALAASLKLSPIELRDALANGRFDSKIQADFAGGVRSGANGTPAFFINGVRFDHPLGADGLPAAIEPMLGADDTTANADAPRRVTVHVQDE